MARSISIVGAGRAGKTLGRCLHRLGWRIGAVVARSDAHARAAVRWIGAGTPHRGITLDAIDSDVILVSAPDDAIAGVASALARAGGAACRGKIVLHTSGALDQRALTPLAHLGASTGSMHPMQTFTGREVPQLKNVIFAVEGAPAARRMAQQITRALGGVPVTIDAKNKVAYHAAGTLVAGHGLGLVEAATRILMHAGFTRRRATQAALPLMRQMLDNFERAGPRASWTGPISRGDFAVVEAHARALRAYPREFRQAYAALALLGARVLAQNSKATIQSLHRALRTIERRLF